MPEIILHLGAHRTASTYVQGVMSKNANRLAAAGIGVPSQENTRSALTERLHSHMPKLPFEGGFEQLLQESGLGGCNTVIISDENILGFLNDIFSHQSFYPDTASRALRLAQLLPQPPRKVLLSIRPYESFFPSAYARWVSPGRPVLSREKIEEIVLGFTRGWADITADIKAAFPDSELVVSEYHADDSYGFSQLTRLLESQTKGLAFTSGYRWNRGMSGHQTWRYEQALEQGEHMGLSAEKIRKLIRPGQPRLAEGFWSEDVLSALQQRYLQDRAEVIRQVPAFVSANPTTPQDAG